MRPVHKNHVLRMQTQCARCFTVLGLTPDMTEDQFETESLRLIHETMPHLRHEVEIALSARDKTVETGDDEEHYKTAFYKQIQQCFMRPTQLLIARAFNAADVTACNRAIGVARKDLETMIGTEQNDLKALIPIALKEFDAAALIARSDNPDITREEAHKQLGMGR